MTKKARDGQRREGQPRLGGGAADLPGTSPFPGCQKGLVRNNLNKNKKGKIKQSDI